MELVYPINEDVCSGLVGLPVCAVLHDGTRHYGILSRVENGRLILNDDAESERSDVATAKRSKVRNVKRSAKRSKSSKANTQSFPETGEYPFFLESRPFFGERVALDLAAIALLFLLWI